MAYQRALRREEGEWRVIVSVSRGEGRESGMVKVTLNKTDKVKGGR